MVIFVFVIMHGSGRATNIGEYVLIMSGRHEVDVRRVGRVGRVGRVVRVGLVG